jgi:putative DNA primase/helicase
MGIDLVRRLAPSLSPAFHNSAALHPMASFSSKVMVCGINFSFGVGFPCFYFTCFWKAPARGKLHVLPNYLLSFRSYPVLNVLKTIGFSKKQTHTEALMREQIGDESVFSRIAEFKKGLIQFTDSTNAMRLVKEHGQDIRYNAAWKKWVVWNGKYWEMDEGDGLIHAKGLEMVRNIYEDLLKTADYRERIDIEKAAMTSESVRRRKSFVEAATWISALRIKTDELDTNPWLLNVKNGTVDMQSGEFREHKQQDMITKIANVEYSPDADCPMWKQFVREIMDCKADIIKFVQTAAGWSLSGDISEQTMFILYGTGANGKSTFLNTIMYLLGDYAIATPTETFMKKSGDNYSNDVARLRGTRFVTTTEVEQGRRLSEPLIKKITGNDEMTARFLYGEFFNFAPIDTRMGLSGVLAGLLSRYCFNASA